MFAFEIDYVGVILLLQLNVHCERNYIHPEEYSVNKIKLELQQLSDQILPNVWPIFLK